MKQRGFALAAGMLALSLLAGPVRADQGGAIDLEVAQALSDRPDSPEGKDPAYHRLRPTSAVLFTAMTKGSTQVLVFRTADPSVLDFYSRKPLQLGWERARQELKKDTKTSGGYRADFHKGKLRFSVGIQWGHGREELYDVVLSFPNGMAERILGKGYKTVQPSCLALPKIKVRKACVTSGGVAVISLDCGKVRPDGFELMVFRDKQGALYQAEPEPENPGSSSSGATFATISIPLTFDWSRSGP